MRNGPVGAWIAAGVNVTLAAFYLQLASSNLAYSPPSEEQPFYRLLVTLSLAIPALMGATSLCLILSLVRRHQTPWQIALNLQRAVFWALALRAVAIMMFAFTLVNESGTATFTLIAGFLELIPATIALMSSRYLRGLDFPNSAYSAYSSLSQRTGILHSVPGNRVANIRILEIPII